jgi:hypothetical protein
MIIYSKNKETSNRRRIIMHKSVTFVESLRKWNNNDCKQSFINAYSLMEYFDIDKYRIEKTLLDLHNALNKEIENEG